MKYTILIVNLIKINHITIYFYYFCIMNLQKQPLVSWIIAVYNTADYLAQCLDSVIAQTYPHWEIILVNDGSTDSSATICDQYAAKDQRIKVLHKANTGKSDSCNKAIALAHGEYIGIIDSDDWIEPNLTKVLLNAIQQTGKDSAGCGYLNEFTDETIADPVCHQLQPLTAVEAIVMLYDRRLYGYLHGRLYRRELLIEPIPRITRYEDFAVLYQWLSHGNGMTLCPECLYHYRQRQSSIMNSQHDHMFGYVSLQAACYQFLNEHQLLPLKQNQELLTRNAIRIAKAIAREMEYEEAFTRISDIRDILNSLQLLDYQAYNLKLRWRLWLLKHSVRAFMALMRLSLHTSSKEKTDNNKYFK